MELENNDKMVEESKKVYEKFLFPISSKWTPLLRCNLLFYYTKQRKEGRKSKAGKEKQYKN